MTTEQPIPLSERVRDPKYVPKEAYMRIEEFVDTSFDHVGRLTGGIDARDVLDSFILKPGFELVMYLREIPLPRRRVRKVITDVCSAEKYRVRHSFEVREMKSRFMQWYLAKIGKDNPSI